MLRRFTKLALCKSLIVLVLLWIAQGICQAQVPFRLAAAQVCLGTTPSCDSNMSFSGSASLNGSFGSVGQPQITVDSIANSSYGVLRSSASERFLIPGSTPAQAYGDGAAQFQDIMTVNFDPFTGSYGYLFVQYTLTGTNSIAGTAHSFAFVTACVYGGALPFSCGQETHTSPSVAGLFVVQKTFRFIYGQPFALLFDLVSFSGTVTPLANGWTSPRVTGQGSGMAAFSNTLVVSGLQVFDSQMSPVTGAQIVSASGTPYSTENGVGLTIPIDIKPGAEPATINPISEGRTTVAILSDSTFDAVAQVDTASLTFGSLGTEHSLDSCRPNGDDVNGDGLVDLVCQFTTSVAGFQSGDKKGILRGQTRSGIPIVGTASVRIVQ